VPDVIPLQPEDRRSLTSRHVIRDAETGERRHSVEEMDSKNEREVVDDLWKEEIELSERTHEELNYVTADVEPDHKRTHKSGWNSEGDA